MTELDTKSGSAVRAVVYFMSFQREKKNTKQKCVMEKYNFVIILENDIHANNFDNILKL